MESGLGKRKFFSLIFCCCFSTFFSNKPLLKNVEIKASENLRVEVKSIFEQYITQIKNESSDFINGYRVYIFYAYDKVLKKNEFCFTLGYILDANSYKYYHDDISYYLQIGEEYIFLKMKEEDSDFADQLGFSRVNHPILVKIVQKLHPPIPGAGFTYSQKPMAGCFTNDSVFFQRYHHEQLPERFRQISD